MLQCSATVSQTLRAAMAARFFGVLFDRLFIVGECCVMITPSKIATYIYVSVSRHQIQILPISLSALYFEQLLELPMRHTHNS